MKYLTTREVAEITRFSEWTIRQRACEYQRDAKARRRNPQGLKGFQVGRQWRFRPQDVEAFIQSR